MFQARIVMSATVKDNDFLEAAGHATVVVDFMFDDAKLLSSWLRDRKDETKVLDLGVTFITPTEIFDFKRLSHEELIYYAGNGWVHLKMNELDTWEQDGLEDDHWVEAAPEKQKVVMSDGEDAVRFSSDLVEGGSIISCAIGCEDLLAILDEVEQTPLQKMSTDGQIAFALHSWWIEQDEDTRERLKMLCGFTSPEKDALLDALAADKLEGAAELGLNTGRVLQRLMDWPEERGEAAWRSVVAAGLMTVGEAAPPQLDA